MVTPMVMETGTRTSGLVKMVRETETGIMEVKTEMETEMEMAT